MKNLKYKILSIILLAGLTSAEAAPYSASDTAEYSASATADKIYDSMPESGSLNDYAIYFLQNIPWDNISDSDARKTLQEINGRNIDMKHKIANGMHHTRATPMLKEIDANMFWFMAEVEPLADVVIRSHVHKSLGTYQDGKFGFITPALMGLGDKYGSRQCGNVTVEFGFLVLDIPNDKEKSLTWKFETMKGVVNKNQCEVL